LASDRGRQAIRDLDMLLARMQPVLNPGRYAFVTLPAETAIDPASVIASIREPEGLSTILTEQDDLVGSSGNR